jgi:hypothetical protein
VSQATFAIVTYDAQGRPLVGVHVILSVGQDYVTNADGYVAFTVETGSIQFSAHKPGYTSPSSPIVDVQGNTQVAHTLTRDIPAPVQLHVSQQVFVDRQGRRVFLKGATSFLLYKRCLDGEDITPQLQELHDLGCNMVVIFGMVVGFPVGEWAKFRPQAYGDRYYTRLRSFCQLCGEWGMYVYFCVFADTQHIMPALPDQLRHFNRVDQELSQEPNVLLRLVNEQNAHENGVERAAFPNPRTEPACSMDYGEEFGGSRYPPPYWDFGDNHTPRTYPKSVKDICQADNPNYLAGECTIVGEPDKFGFDHYTNRTYQMDPVRAREMAGTARGTCAGVVFHSTDGVYAERLSAPVTACAEAWFAELG